MIQSVYRFLHNLEVVRNVSPHTLRNYRLDLTAFKAYLGKNPSLTAIDKKVIRAYLTHLNYKGVSKRTIVRHLSSLRSFFKYLLKEKTLKENPMEELSLIHI